MKKKITSEIVVAYAQCLRKAYLLMHSNETGRTNEYAGILEQQKFINQNAYLDSLRLQDLDVRPYKSTNLRTGSSFLINGILQSKDFEAVCGVLTKVASPSSVGEYSYEPAIFVGTHEIYSDQKLELIFVGYVLEQVQGRAPAFGRIIGTGLKPHKVSLENGYKMLTPILQDLYSSIQAKSPEPPLILNKHCPYCQFEHICRAQAEKDDNLSLLDRATTKLLQHYGKKGIFTVKQLSYLYKPRRRNKRAKNLPLPLHKLELQALAITTGKIYLQELPKLTREPVELFLDIEGIPDQQYNYLIGLLVCEDTIPCKYYSFWADTHEQEAQIWQQFTEKINHYPGAPIYHYGYYEVRALAKLARRYEGNIEDINRRLINVNTYIYGLVYFPVYSNSLKDIGKFIGATWTSPNASGMQSIVWRCHWDDTHDPKYRDLLVTYNQEDCQALNLLTNELSKIKNFADTLSEVDFADQPKQWASEGSTELHHQFETILELAHADYDKKKISLQRSKTSNDAKRKRGGQKGHPGYTKLIPPADKVICLPMRTECPEHKGEALEESQRVSECTIIDLTFVESGIKKTVTKYTGKKGFCRKCHRYYNPLEQKSDYLVYGHGFQAWVVYHRLFLRLPYRVITQTLVDQFGEKISEATIINFLRYFSSYYSQTEQLLTQKILESPFVHVDETKINIQGVEQYVWVFTDGRHVVFQLTSTREAEVVHKFLSAYDGTLISDFYPGYDSVKCKQQKCWVHLIRDINDDLWKSPFDSEFEGFVLEMRNLIVPILETLEEYGSKREYLNKFNANVKQFYRETINKSYRSELSLKYQKRFVRYKESLFTFLEHDGIPWNNNAGERALRHLAVQRKISGSFFESFTPQYLLLLGIMQTCRFRGKSLLKFLLSRDVEI